MWYCKNVHLPFNSLWWGKGYRGTHENNELSHSYVKNDHDLLSNLNFSDSKSHIHICPNYHNAKNTVCIGCHGSQFCCCFCLSIIFISFIRKLTSEQRFGTGKCITQLNMGLLCIYRITRSHIFLTSQNIILWHGCYDIYMYHSSNSL